MLTRSHLTLFLVLACLALASGCAKTVRTEGQPATGQSGKQPAYSQRYNDALEAMKKRDYGSAEPILTELAGNYPDRAGPHLNLGVIYAASGRTLDALNSLRDGLRIDRDNPQAWNLLGAVLRRNGEVHKAERAYQAAIRIDPDSANPYLNLAILYDEHLDEPRLALENYRKFLSLSEQRDPRIIIWIDELEQQLSSAQ